MSVLSLSEVSFSHSDRIIVNRLTLDVADHEVLAVVGPSGTGKSTLLRLILGLLAPSQGTIEVSGKLASKDGKVIVSPKDRNLSAVFQDLALWPHMTVYENLEFGLSARKVPQIERANRIHAMLERVNLADKALRLPGQLSGGERQRVAIARALVSDPVAILFDEPMSNLDSVLKHTLLSVFRDLLKERRLPAVYVTHSVEEAAWLADRIAVIEEGRITQSGTFDDLRANPLTPFVRALLESSCALGPK